MGKIELKIEIDEAFAEKAKARGLTAAEAVEDLVRKSMDEKRIDLVAAAARQRADPGGAEARAKQWVEENAEAIKANNERIARRGVFGEDLRRW